ncbi:MAG: hypothetical protein AAGJ50_01525 [Pseudomonadota bacterium]
MSEITVTGPDGNKYRFPAGTDQEVMRQAMRQRFGGPRELPNQFGAETGQTVGELPGPDSAARALQRFEDAGVDISQPADSQGFVDATRDGANRAVIRSDVRENGRRSAFANQAANSLLLGTGSRVAGAANVVRGGSFEDGKRAADQRIQAEREVHPVTSTAGELAGFLAPGTLALKGGTSALRSLPGAGRAASMLPQGASRGAQAARYAGTTLAPASIAGAADYGLYEATVGASNQEADTGETQSLSDRVGRGVDGATDPLALALGPAASLAYRAVRPAATNLLNTIPGVNIRSAGLSTPPEVLERENARSALGAVLDATPRGDLSGNAAKAFTRILSRGGMGRDDIAAAVNDATLLLKGIDDGGVTRSKLPAQVYSELLEQRGFPRAAQNINTTLQERLLASGPNDQSQTIVSNAFRNQRESQVPFVQDSLKTNLGDISRRTAKDAIDEGKARLGEAYEQALSRPISADQAQRIQAILTGPGMELLHRPLKEIAAGEGLDIERFVQADPVRTAHWMQSKANALSESNNLVQATAFSNLRRRILDALEGAVPGYREIRVRYGEEHQAEQALNFGRTFLTRAANEGELSNMKAEFDALPPWAQETARLSARDAIGATLRGGPEDAAARLARVTSIGALDAMESVFGPQGKALADDIRSIRGEQNYLNSIDPNANSRTASNQQAIKEAPSLRNSMLANVFAADESLLKAPVRGLKRLGRAAFGTGNRTNEELSRFLTGTPADAPSQPVNAFNRSGEDGFSAGSVLPPLAGASGGYVAAPDMDGDGEVSLGERGISSLAWLAAGTGISAGASRLPRRQGTVSPRSELPPQAVEPANDPYTSALRTKADAIQEAIGQVRLRGGPDATNTIRSLSRELEATRQAIGDPEPIQNNLLLRSIAGAAGLGGIAAINGPDPTERIKLEHAGPTPETLDVISGDYGRRNLRNASALARKGIDSFHTNIDRIPSLESLPHTRFAQDRTGVRSQFLDRLYQHESGNDPSAQNPLSSAFGRSQFINSTWLRALRKHGHKYGLDFDPADHRNRERALRLREDPRWSAYITAEFTKENVDFLQSRLYRPITEKDAYLAHFLGRDAALKALRADPSEPAARLFIREAQSNPNVFFVGGDTTRPRSVGEFIRNQTRNFRDEIVNIEGGDQLFPALNNASPPQS